jgi:hypothetical protein
VTEGMKVGEHPRAKEIASPSPRKPGPSAEASWRYSTGLIGKQRVFRFKIVIPKSAIQIESAVNDSSGQKSGSSLLRSGENSGL